MVRRRTESFAWTALALLGLLGCGGDASQSCTSGADCPRGLACIDGMCGACSEDAQCSHLGAGASCQSGVCVSACGEGGCACAAGAEGCTCRSGSDPCDDGLACREGTCTPCEPGGEGCACDGDACDGDLVCTSAGLCLAPTTCSVLRDAGLCPEGRRCEIMGGAARCLDVCDDGFEKDDSGTCVLCGEGGCAPAVTCEDCAAAHRECDESGPTTRCGACSAGYRLDEESGECVDERLCGDVLCGDDEMPEHAPDGSCTCVPRACREGEARTPDGRCIACPLTCGGTGETGAIASRTTAGGVCVCETEPGYFIPDGGDRRAAPCDEDGDGWVRKSAMSARASGDLVLVENARCTVLEAERVELTNEYGQTLTVWSCGDGLFAGESDAVCATRGGVRPIALVESDRNDSPRLLALHAGGMAPTAPPYAHGGVGRAFEAAELNSLTTACVSQHADFDDDGMPDIAQAQPTGMAARSNEARLAAFAHFVELHTSEFVPSAMGGAGAIAIAERSRCDGASFPLGYEPTDGAYWRECHRRRHPSMSPHPWADFAQWSCGGAAECSVPLPPTGASPDPTNAPQHGLCELGASADWGEWRGMHHHSQFRCVLVDAGSREPHAVDPSAIYDGTTGTLSFQRCYANDASASAPFTCMLEGRPHAGAATVGWAAVRYSDGTTGGCIDESTEPHASGTWADALCPDPGHLTLFPAGDPDDFGRLHCGNCPDPVHYVLDVDRDGFGAPGTDTYRCINPGGLYIVQRADGAYDCDDIDANRNPGATDVPDMLAYDADCDFVDGDEDALIFVDPNTTAPTQDGTRTAPFASIYDAIAAAAGTGRDVALRAEKYELDTTIVLPDGVSLYGGYGPGFTTRGDDPPTVIEVRGLVEIPLATLGVSDPLNTYGIESIWVNVALDASEVRSNTTLQLLTIRAVTDTDPPAGSTGTPVSQSYYGIRGVSTENLVLDHVIVEAADGADGASAPPAAEGAPGEPGQQGFPRPGEHCPHDAETNPGGLGGNSACGGRGGRGGDGRDKDKGGPGENGQRGNDGATAIGGAAGGTGGRPGAGGGERSYGGNGAQGGDAEHGRAPDATKAVHGGFWIPRAGFPGGEGGAGGGGGGGGGGDIDGGSAGTGGGGGGGGGCGGPGGGGGLGGGASFAAYFPGGRNIQIVESVLRAGSGGRGGNGAAGGNGGPGGAGGIDGEDQAFCERGGRAGGRGGHGGRGGNGAGGAGGDSVALVGPRSGVTVDTATVLEIGAAGTGGAGATMMCDGLGSCWSVNSGPDGRATMRSDD